MLKIRENVSLAKLTTFGIGGEARYLVEVKSNAEIREALLWTRERSMPFIVIAGGSNLLIRDEGLDGLVIKIVSAKWSLQGATLEAEAGCNLLNLIRSASVMGLGGWEKLAGIPGTIGGAVRGNAGAFGPEMKDFLVWAKALNATTFEEHEFSNAECNFAYRMSHFKRHPELIITKVHLSLQTGDPRESAKVIEQTIAERERRHIQDVRAAGSFFMNPVVSESIREQFETEKNAKSREGRVPAGWLIEKAGMKGARRGDAAASNQHPNYLVNVGKATASDVRALASEIKQKVRERFSVELEEEAVVF